MSSNHAKLALFYAAFLGFCAAANASEPLWTLAQGSDLIFRESVPRDLHGVRGIPSPSNWPGVRAGAAAWTDRDGRLWLFSGIGQDAKGNEGFLQDFWVLPLPRNAVESGAWMKME